MNQPTRTGWMVGTMAIAAAVLPWQGAQAWDHGGGHYGGGGHHYGYYGGGHHHGCRGCGAAIVGLAVGTIIGAAMTDAARPRVVVEEPAYRQPRAPRPYPRDDRDDAYTERTCRSIMVNGVPYHNCGYPSRADADW